jgi:hypothetical protein
MYRLSRKKAAMKTKTADNNRMHPSGEAARF